VPIDVLQKCCPYPPYSGGVNNGNTDGNTDGTWSIRIFQKIDSDEDGQTFALVSMRRKINNRERTSKNTDDGDPSSQ
jgi:hypothetical protein